jgi:AraC-like DNA-binding protein
MHVFFAIDGRYNTATNYVNSFLSLGIFYFIAYGLLSTPDQISPDFSEKYRSYMQFVGEDGEKYLRKLRSLMSDRKIFTNPDLNLAMLAEHMELPAHQLSKLINEKFGKSFTDFVNEFRVNEFITRMSTLQYRSYSVYGLALDVGFNSKSSFNAAFKKITGKSPAQYKSAL